MERACCKGVQACYSLLFLPCHFHVTYTEGRMLAGPPTLFHLLGTILLVDTQMKPGLHIHISLNDVTWLANSNLHWQQHYKQQVNLCTCNPYWVWVFHFHFRFNFHFHFCFSICPSHTYACTSQCWSILQSTVVHWLVWWQQHSCM